MGNHAKVALIFAQTDPEQGHRGLAASSSTPTSPGLPAAGDPREDGPARLGHRGARPRLGATSDDDAMLGEVGEGFKVAMSALDSGRFSVAAGCVGICQGCVDESVAYAKEREQFGRPIASFQLVQAMIADMKVQTDAARMLVWRAGWLKDQGQPNTTGDVDREALRDRGGGQSCANTAIQVHGGVGLRRRPPGRALVPRRPRDHALRGHLADPEAHHRARGDRDQRARSRLAACSSSGSSAPARWAPASRSSPRQAGARDAAARPRRRRARARAGADRGGHRAKAREGPARRRRASRCEPAAELADARRLRRRRSRRSPESLELKRRAVRRRRRGRGRRLRARHQHVVAAGDARSPPACPGPSASSACTSSTRRR